MRLWSIVTLMWGMLAATAQAAMAGKVSEVLTGPYTTTAVSLPAYVELYEVGATGAFDLVVLDAQPDRLWRVRSVTTITPVAGVNTYVIHTGIWGPGFLGPGEVISAASMGLGISSGGSRTLAIYNRTTGFIANTRPSDAALFNGLIETVTYSLNNIAAQAMRGETILKGTFGQAMRRSVAGGDYTDQWTIGPILNQDLYLNGSMALNPGLVNVEIASPPEHMPEPGMAGLLGAGLVLIRRRRRNQRV